MITTGLRKTQNIYCGRICHFFVSFTKYKHLCNDSFLKGKRKEENGKERKGKEMK